MKAFLILCLLFPALSFSNPDSEVCEKIESDLNKARTDKSKIYMVLDEAYATADKALMDYDEALASLDEKLMDYENIISDYGKALEEKIENCLLKEEK